jgi:hypothetical protein
MTIRFAMMRKTALGVVSLVLFLFLQAAHPLAAQNTITKAKAARIELVKEFIREVEVLDGLQQTAKKEFGEDKSSNGQLVTAIRVGTRTLFEMNTGVGILDRISLDGRWDEFRTALISIDTERASLNKEMIDASKKLLSGPEEGVNYGALLARAPELTAQVEQLDKMIFNISKAMFLGLLDEERTDKDGNISHLIVTARERNEMIQGIDIHFGSRLEDKNTTQIVLAAWAIKYGLTQSRYRSADEAQR